MKEKKPLVYLVAGEASGDFLGANLMDSLNHIQDNNIEFAGVGGSLMEARGLVSIFPMKELSIMGLVEIIPHIPNVMSRLSQTVRDIEHRTPDVVVTLDAPSFNFRLAKKLQHTNIPLIHYTAPTVWAWRPGRAKKISRLYRHLLTLFSFEPPFFEAWGLESTFVGHPLSTYKIDEADSILFRTRHGIPEKSPLLCVLPGSRQGELERLLPVFIQTIHKLATCIPGIHIAVPTLPHHVETIKTFFRDIEIPVHITSTEKEKYEAMVASNAALAASGTVTLELSLAQTPMVVAYKVNPITAFMMKFLLKTPFVALPNIIMKTQIVPEYIQEKCTSDNLVDALKDILLSSKHNNGQREKLKEIKRHLSNPDGSPGELAAKVVTRFLH